MDDLGVLTADVDHGLGLGGEQVRARGMVATAAHPLRLRFAALGWVAGWIGKHHLPDFRPDVVHAHDWQAGLAPGACARMSWTTRAMKGGAR